MSKDNNPFGIPDQEEWLTKTDRKRRMLTRDDRKYLAGEKEVKESSRPTTNHRIRKRIRGAIRDFSFIIETGNSHLIDGPANVHEIVKKPLILNFIHSSLLYAYSFLYEYDKNSENPSTTTDSIAHIEDLIADALEEIVVGGDYHHVDSVDVNINIEGMTSGEKYLLENFMDDYKTTITNYEQWSYAGGDKEALKQRLKKEGEELEVWDNRMNNIEFKIKPDE